MNNFLKLLPLILTRTVHFYKHFGQQRILFIIYFLICYILLSSRSIRFLCVFFLEKMFPITFISIKCFCLLLFLLLLLVPPKKTNWLAWTKKKGLLYNKKNFRLYNDDNTIIINWNKIETKFKIVSHSQKFIEKRRPVSVDYVPSSWSRTYWQGKD
jgi:hypothetical protein